MSFRSAGAVRAGCGLTLMWNRQLELVDRVLEDEGLVAGLTEEAAGVVRAWCIEQALGLAERNGVECAAVAVDELVARARLLTEVVNELQSGVPERRVLARLGRLVPNGPQALSTLESARPLPERLREVLAGMAGRCLH